MDWMGTLLYLLSWLFIWGRPFVGGNPASASLLSSMKLSKGGSSSLSSREKVPQFMKEEFLRRKGNAEALYNHFREPGIHAGTSDTLRTVKARLQPNGTVSFSSPFPIYRGETLRAAILKVFWKPDLRKISPESRTLLEKIAPKFPLRVWESGLLDTKWLPYQDPIIDEGWYSLDIFPAMKSGPPAIRLEVGDIVFRQESSLKLAPRGKIYQAYLLLYSEGETNSKIRKKRSAKKSKSRSKLSRDNGLCKRHELYVNFVEVKWSDWVIAPSGYDAYYCKGKCKFPLPDHLNATNHAVITSIMKDVYKTHSGPCCVPTKLSAISLLHEDEYGDVALKSYEDMVVEACGCR